MKRSSMLALGFLLACTACAGSPPGVRVENAWARPTPPSATVGAAFLTLEAASNDRLLSASSAICERVEIHSMSMSGETMQMRPLQSLDLPAGKRVELRADGTHLMLLGLKQPLAPQSQFDLKLKFERAGEQTVTVRVGAMGG